MERHAVGRSGAYVLQLTGYRAFEPTPLPPVPPIALNGDLQRLLSLADVALGRLDGSIQTLPNSDLFIFMYVRREAVLSSQIEGTQSSLQDLLAAEADILSPDSPNDVAEVINYVKAMNHGIARLPDLPVSVGLIREIHERLMRGTRGSTLTPGEIRRTQNWIGPGGCSLTEATFVPPPPHLIAPALNDLEKFLHQTDEMPLLIKIALAHAQFETIHPFLDGNGRVRRLLITFLLCEKQALQKPVLYLSYYFKKHRQQYYELLQATRDKGAWEEWLTFFLIGVNEVSIQATQTARRILALREKHRREIALNLGYTSGNGHIVLDELFTRPIISVKQVQELTGTTYPAANNLVERLKTLGIIEEITGQARNRRFCYTQYMRLFQDETDTPLKIA